MLKWLLKSLKWNLISSFPLHWEETFPLSFLYFYLLCEGASASGHWESGAKAFFSNWSRIFIINLISCSFWAPLGRREGRKLELGRVISNGTSRILILKTLHGFAAAAWIRGPFNLLLIKTLFIYSVPSSEVPRHLTNLWCCVWNAKCIFMWCWDFTWKLRMKESFTLIFLFSFRASDPDYRAAFKHCCCTCLLSMSCSLKCKHWPSINSLSGCYI